MGYMLNNPLSSTDSVLHPYICLSFVGKLQRKTGFSLPHAVINKHNKIRILSCSAECNGSSSYVKKKVVSQVLYFGDRFQKLPRLLGLDMFIDIMRIMRKVQQE